MDSKAKPAGRIPDPYDVIRFLRLSDHPELFPRAAKWFSEKWKIPGNAYLDSMNESLSSDIPEWYLAIFENEIAGGLGVIANDFHERRDLSPNVCAVYTEEKYRLRGIAGKLLSLISRDMAEKGIKTLYLVTDHDSFYERYGWEYLTDVKCDGGEISRMYIHRVVD